MPTPSAWLNGAEAAAAAGGSAPAGKKQTTDDATNPRQRLPSRRGSGGDGDGDGDSGPPLPDFIWDPSDIIGAYAGLLTV